MTATEGLSAPNELYYMQLKDQIVEINEFTWNFNENRQWFGLNECCVCYQGLIWKEKIIKNFSYFDFSVFGNTLEGLGKIMLFSTYKCIRRIHFTVKLCIFLTKIHKTLFTHLTLYFFIAVEKSTFFFYAILILIQKIFEFSM